MIILIGKKSSRIDVDSLKNHYGRLLTWLDLQLITKGLVLIYDSFDLEGRSKGVRAGHRLVVWRVRRNNAARDQTGWYDD